ncbi:hypothetical protein Tco_1335010 [Tanacetum coccineum]
MERTRSKPKELLPYGMILTRLFKHVVSVFPELAIDRYISHDRVMHPLAPHYERKTGSNRGKKRPRESNASSSSTTQNHPSLSHPLDDSIDENNDESFHSNPSSLSQNIFSSSNDVSRVHQNPPHEIGLCAIGSTLQCIFEECPSNDWDVERMSKVSYANAVGSLMYLMVCTRLDIAYAVSIVSRYLANPGKNHSEAVKWILMYLKGTADVGLVYGSDQGKHVDVDGFVDADYANYIDL